MSANEKSVIKGMVYVFTIGLIITGIFAIMMFAPTPTEPQSLISTSIRYYTKGTEKLYYGDYAQLISQNLQEIGIATELHQMEYATFLEKVVQNKEYDLAIMEIEGEEAPHIEQFLKEGANLNIFNFKDSMDSGYTANLTEKILEEPNKQLRTSLLYDLQDHVMDKVLPMVPLFTPARTYVFWNNLEGFSAEWGISNSLPYMSFNGLHAKQQSVNELRIGISKWATLSPLLSREPAEKLILSLVMDKLVLTHPHGRPTHYGLIKNWEYENTTTIVLNARSNAYWQKDYNNKYQNMPFTADDIIFTIKLLTSQETNINYAMYKWITSVEKINDTAVRVFIDSDPQTSVNEPYAYVLEDLSVYPYPSFYLDNGGSIDEIVTSSAWQDYSNHPFGTGKFYINFEETENGLTIVLEKFSLWYNEGVFPQKESNIQFNRIIAKPYRDSYSMMLELGQGGEIDIGDFGKDPSVIDSIIVDDLTYATATENSLIFLAFNLDSINFGGDKNLEPTNQTDLSVGLAIRKAVASIIDKNLINKALHKDMYNVTESIVSNYYTDYYYSEVPHYGKSLSQALRYLELAGFNVTENLINTLRSPYSLLGVYTGLSIMVGITLSKRLKRKKASV